MDFKNRNKMFLAENNFVTYRKKKTTMSFAEDYTENQSVISTSATYRALSTRKTNSLEYAVGVTNWSPKLKALAFNSSP